LALALIAINSSLVRATSRTRSARRSPDSARARRAQLRISVQLTSDMSAPGVAGFARKALHPTWKAMRMSDSLA